MTIPPVEGFIRMGSLHYLYAETAEKGYSEFLETLSNISEFGEVEYDEKLEELKYLRNVAGLQAIVFSACLLYTSRCV